MTAVVATVPAPNSFDQQIEDANRLLEHALSQGKPVADAVIATIVGATRSHIRATPVAPEAWIEFSKAYRKLAEVMGSVTARTLQATSGPGSEARRWSRRLVLFAIGFAVVIIFAENFQAILDAFFARDEYSSGGLLRWHALNMVLQTLVPFALGGLGAATYLLRSAHVHLHGRTFDPNYIPEYYNRLLIGLIAGGTIGLLIDVVTQDGAIIDLSAGALAPW